MALSVQVMGIINVTPDSFFPASRSLAAEDAIARGAAMFDAGCDVVDVGGESTRPGATPVGLDEELARVVPVVAALAPLDPEARRRVLEAVHALLDVSPGRSGGDEPARGATRKRR